MEKKDKVKILVVSDSHGENRYLKKAVQKEASFDLLVHCGDIQGNIYSLLGTDTPYEIHAVRGNCDYSRYSDELLLEVCGHRIFVVHGHSFRVQYDNEMLLREALKRKADMVLFGHTHIPETEYIRGIIFLNPGSISEPRQPGREHTYAVVTIEEGKIPFTEIRVIKDQEIE